jgi:acyl-CoA thioester hydrolase
LRNRFPLIPECRRKIVKEDDEDEILLLTSLAEFTRVKVIFEYKINYQGRATTTGRTVHAWTNRQLKPINLAKGNLRLYQLLEQSGDQ